MEDPFSKKIINMPQAWTWETTASEQKLVVLSLSRVLL